MKQQRNRPTVGRRDVLRALAAGAGVAVAGAAPLAGGAVAAESDQEKRQARYRVSDHIKAYYRVNQYPK
jgi:H+/Cl- antiporter ClcA